MGVENREVPSAASPNTPTVEVTFVVEATTSFGETMGITGGHVSLGSWKNPVILDCKGTYPIWRTEKIVNLPAGVKFEYKYLKMRGPHLSWETFEGNRSVVPQGSKIVVEEKYNVKTAHVVKSVPLTAAPGPDSVSTTTPTANTTTTSPKSPTSPPPAPATTVPLSRTLQPTSPTAGRGPSPSFPVAGPTPDTAPIATEAALPSKPETEPALLVDAAPAVESESEREPEPEPVLDVAASSASAVYVPGEGVVVTGKLLDTRGEPWDAQRCGDVSVAMQGSFGETVDVNVHWLEDGSFRAVGSPEDSGLYSVFVAVQEKSLRGFPSLVKVPGHADLTTSKVSVGVDDDLVWAILELRDSNGRMLVDPAHVIQVIVTSPSGACLPVQQLPAPGLLITKASTTEAGPHTVDVLIASARPAGFPRQLVVPGRVDIGGSSVSHRVDMGEKVLSVELQLRDSQGNCVIRPSQKAHVTLKTPCGEIVDLRGKGKTDSDGVVHIVTPLASFGCHKVSVVTAHGNHSFDGYPAEFMFEAPKRPPSVEPPEPSGTATTASLASPATPSAKASLTCMRENGPDASSISAAFADHGALTKLRSPKGPTAPDPLLQPATTVSPGIESRLVAMRTKSINAPAPTPTAPELNDFKMRSPKGLLSRMSSDSVLGQIHPHGATSAEPKQSPEGKVKGSVTEIVSKFNRSSSLRSTENKIEPTPLPVPIKPRTTSKSFTSFPAPLPQQNGSAS